MLKCASKLLWIEALADANVSIRETGKVSLKQTYETPDTTDSIVDLH